ncbi:MAG: EamA family transporter [Candidatus Micrarchaeia archaeon]
MKLKFYGYIMLAVFLLSAAGVPIAYKYGSGIKTLQLVFFVEVIGTIFSAIFMLIKRTHRYVRAYVTNITQFATLASTGILAFGLESLLLSYSAHFISASLIAVIYRAWPLMLVFMAPFLLRERITKLEVAGMLVGFGAMAVTMLRGTAVSIPTSALPFVAIVLIAAFLDALTSGIQKRYQYELSSSLFMYNLTSLIIVAPIALYFNAVTFAGIGIAAVGAIIFLGLIQNVIMSYAFTASLRSINTAIAGNAYMLVPFLTIALSFLLLNEPIRAYYLVIALGVLAGILIQKATKKEGNYVPVKKSREWHMPVIFDVSSAFINTKSDMIYNAFKGSGRVLAFKVNADKERISSIDANTNGENCIIFSENHSIAKEHISPEEMEFVKEITSASDNETLIFGIGEPSKVEDAFRQAYGKIAGKQL